MVRKAFPLLHQLDWSNISASFFLPHKHNKCHSCHIIYESSNQSTLMLMERLTEYHHQLVPHIVASSNIMSIKSLKVIIDCLITFKAFLFFNKEKWNILCVVIRRYFGTYIYSTTVFTISLNESIVRDQLITKNNSE